MQNEEEASMKALLDLLPAYVNGTASMADRAAVRDLLARSGEARAALAWHEALAARVRADVESAPADVGWERLQARLKSDRHIATAPGLLDRFVRWIGALSPHHWMPAPVLGGVSVALLAVVIGQGLWLGQGASEPDYATVRGTQVTDEGGDAADGSADRLRAMGLGGSRLLRLNFRDRVSERDMRLLLIRAGAVIVGGPGQLGDYIVAVPAHELARARQAFQDSHLTESVQEVPSTVLQPPGASGSTGSEPGQPATSPRTTGG